MRISQVPLDDLGGSGIFEVMARAFALVPQERDNFDRADLPGGAIPAPRPWLDRLDDWFWERERRAVEAYLARSQNVHELEARMRCLERGDRHACY